MRHAKYSLIILFSILQIFEELNVNDFFSFSFLSFARQDGQIGQIHVICPKW